MHFSLTYLRLNGVYHFLSRSWIIICWKKKIMDFLYINKCFWVNLKFFPLLPFSYQSLWQVVVFYVVNENRSAMCPNQEIITCNHYKHSLTSRAFGEIFQMHEYKVHTISLEWHKKQFFLYIYSNKWASIQLKCLKRKQTKSFIKVTSEGNILCIMLFGVFYWLLFFYQLAFFLLHSTYI